MRLNLTTTIQHCQPTLYDLYEAARLTGMGYLDLAAELDQLLAEGRILIGSEMQVQPCQPHRF